MEADPPDPEMVKIDVKVTARQKAEIDRVWKDRGYPSRSEFVRDALREATAPTLTPQALREIADGLADIEAGRTIPLGDERLTPDDD